jgi:hypothetical protein
MATIDELCDDGTLERFEPQLDPGELPQRVVYLAPVAHEWCFSSRELGHQTPNPHSYDRVRALLSEFCAGRLLLHGAHVRNLRPPGNRIWEFKTIPPERHSVRIFGWFYRPCVFIGCLCKYKNDVSPGCVCEINSVLAYRSRLPLDEPKTAKETSYDALLQANG